MERFQILFSIILSVSQDTQYCTVLYIYIMYIYCITFFIYIIHHSQTWRSIKRILKLVNFFFLFNCHRATHTHIYIYIYTYIYNIIIYIYISWTFRISNLQVHLNSLIFTCILCEVSLKSYEKFNSSHSCNGSY